MSGPQPDDDDMNELPKSLWAELGLPEPAYRDEESAPDVDRDLLLQLVRQELPEKTARAVYRLIHSFRSWNDAHAEIVAAEFRRTHGKE